MDRRKSIKALVLGTASSAILFDACDTADKKAVSDGNLSASVAGDNADRMPEEIEVNKKLHDDRFFSSDEMATIALLADIIIPKDEVSGSASDAKVADFIEFTVKDQPEFQIPLRGGLRWLELQCLNRYERAFKESSPAQQLEMIDQIAYPKKAKPEYKQGVSFFSLMRNLTVSGFYTTEIGVKDVGYVGNKPNQWNGVPDDVLKEYKISYSEKDLKECMSYDQK